MKASFGANISGLRKTKSVWMDDATYKDVVLATFTKSETDAITRKLSQVGKLFRKINASELKSFLRLQNSFTGKFLLVLVSKHTIIPRSDLEQQL